MLLSCVICIMIDKRSCWCKAGHLGYFQVALNDDEPSIVNLHQTLPLCCVIKSLLGAI